ncbi:hypothetical protein EGR_01071 [Echinococcus granulosus]|uniref:Uncharacterized protein n=1 Tax=Echinococcus granulosus TaxID=6210 RepID=W6URV3_ECHGR|nr:hypothetical protein EGR_01071 [Echinococcus granulosus]EUB63943.1 hypothetical protein EGR_01071 [Echinococcus granulosus]
MVAFTQYDDLSSSPGHAYGKVDGEDAEVDFELDLPNLAATAANGFRDEDLPAMPIVLKKTRSSHSRTSVIGPNTLLAAGGGGNSKTGVPNRIDVIHFDRPACAPISQDANEALIPANTTLIGGLNTKHEAIMHMTLGCQSPGAASILALEGSTCQEYFLHANDLEPSTIADEVLTEQESAISSTGVARYFQHQHTPSSASSSSEDNHSNTGVSSTTMARRFSARTTLFEASQVAKKTPADSSGEEQLPWTCEALRSVSVAPTKALMERRRLDSCSSTGSVSALLDDGDELTCITSGGPAGGGWCAVGTVHGGVALIDRYALVEETRYSLSPRSPSNASYAFTFDNNEEDVIFPLQLTFVSGLSDRNSSEHSFI